MTKLEELARIIDPASWHLFDIALTAGQAIVWKSARDESMEKARAVIAALREPSEAMIEAARDRIWEFSPDYALTERDPKGEHPDSVESVAKDAFTAMIDAILREADEG